MARRKIQNKSPKKETQSGRKKSISEHPILITLIGFILTAFFGNMIASNISRSIAEYNELTAAIYEFSTIIYERRTRAILVLSSINAGSDDEELMYRKKMYDESYVRWNTLIRKNLFLMRHALKSEDYTPLEQLVETDVTRLLGRLDSCITKLYRERHDNKNLNLSGEKYDNCKAIADSTINCLYSITDEYSRSVERLKKRTYTPLPDLFIDALHLPSIWNENAITTVRNACNTPREL